MGLWVPLGILAVAAIMALAEARLLRMRGPLQMFAAGWALLVAAGAAVLLLSSGVARDPGDAIDAPGGGAYPTFDRDRPYPTTNPNAVGTRR